MKFSSVSKIGLALLGTGLGLAAAAQTPHAQVRAVNADQARSHMEASMKAAARGQKVGMLTGRANPQPVKLANGAVAQELDASSMVYTVARVNADGRVEMVCVNGADAAQQALQAPAMSKRISLAAKEHTHVK